MNNKNKKLDFNLDFLSNDPTSATVYSRTNKTANQDKTQMKYNRNIFTPHGKLNRLHYFLYLIVLCFCGFIFSTLTNIFNPMNYVNSSIHVQLFTLLIFLLIGLISFYISLLHIFNRKKRLMDILKNNHITWILAIVYDLFIALLNTPAIYLILIMLLVIEGIFLLYKGNEDIEGKELKEQYIPMYVTISCISILLFSFLLTFINLYHELYSQKSFSNNVETKQHVNYSTDKPIQNINQQDSTQKIKLLWNQSQDICNKKFSTYNDVTQCRLDYLDKHTSQNDKFYKVVNYCMGSSGINEGTSDCITEIINSHN